MARSKGARAAGVKPMKAKIVTTLSSACVIDGRYGVHIDVFQGQSLIAVIRCPYEQYSTEGAAANWGRRICKRLGIALHHTRGGAR